ncbi:hypothetical protein CsSME_00019308 [Camellia sinensis var. sinensis]
MVCSNHSSAFFESGLPWNSSGLALKNSLVRKLALVSVTFSLAWVSALKMFMDSLNAPAISWAKAPVAAWPAWPGTSACPSCSATSAWPRPSFCTGTSWTDTSYKPRRPRPHLPPLPPRVRTLPDILIKGQDKQFST